MANKPNTKEQALLEKMQKALAKHKKPDNREGGHYFEPGTEKVFQGLARELAQLIEDQGIAKTCPQLRTLAKKLQGLEEIEWNHANSIGFTFDQGLQETGSNKRNANPFSGMKM